MIENITLALRLIPTEFLNTCLMVFLSALFAGILGFFWGMALYLTQKGGMCAHSFFYQLLGIAANIGRSIPFAILMIVLIPFTRFIVGTSIGTVASVVPLTIAAAPFFARLVQSAFDEVSADVIDAAKVMGSKRSQIAFKVVVPESWPTLISGFTLMTINLIGYSAMAGLVGGGGLGKVAIQYGYQRFNGFLMILTLLVILALVEVVQFLGSTSVHAIYKKRGER